MDKKKEHLKNFMQEKPVMLSFKKRFFTLIELLVVIIIMTVITSILAPQMEHFYQNIVFDSSIHRFRLLLEKARAISNSDQKACRMVIKPGWRDIYLETEKIPVINSPGSAVKYIEKLKKPSFSEAEDSSSGSTFVPVEGEFSRITLPQGIRINYISVDGQRKAPVQEIVITFYNFHQQHTVKFSFESNRGTYRGLQLEPGSGLITGLQIIKEN